MTDRDDRFVGTEAANIPRTTGEFRAAPDISASTAEFKAFAARQSDDVRRPADAGSWPEQPWAGEAPSGGSGRTIALVVGGVVVLALIIVLAVIFG